MSDQVITTRHSTEEGGGSADGGGVGKGGT